MKDTIKDTVKDGMSDGITGWITEPRTQILAAITANPRITAVELSAFLNLNLRNTKKNIAFLKTSRHLLRVDSDKSGYWEILRPRV